MSIRIYESVLKAAADPTRVRILKMLESGEMCVCQMIAVLSLGQSTVSKHLFLLRSAGLINDRKDKKWVFYALEKDPVNPYAEQLIKSLRKWLSDDVVISADREKTAIARELGPEGVIAGNMKLPACIRCGNAEKKGK